MSPTGDECTYISDKAEPTPEEMKGKSSSEGAQIQHGYADQVCAVFSNDEKKCNDKMLCQYFLLFFCSCALISKLAL